MTPENRPSAEEEKNVLDSRQREKRPYKKPGFRSENVFETMALACGKHVGAGGQGKFRRRSS
jgi:hypothetical protein